MTQTLSIIIPAYNEEKTIHLVLDKILAVKLLDDIQKEIDSTEKAGGMGEDEKFRAKAELQKLVDALNKKLNDAYERKDKEIGS